MGGMVHINQSEIKQAIQAYQVNHTQRYDDLYSLDEYTRLRHAAVLLPLFMQENEWHLLFTQRADSMEEHRGQVAFPGGAREKQDLNLCETALREMHEEIGVKPEDVQVFGHLGDLPVVTGYLVRPYVGQIPWPYAFNLASVEVQSIFSIPIDWLVDPSNRQVQYRSIAGREFPVIYFQHYDGYQLWGASGEMTIALLNALNLIK